MSSGNGQGHVPIEVFDRSLGSTSPTTRAALVLHPARRRRSLVIALVLFAATLLSTLASGVEFARDYSRNKPTSLEDFFQGYVAIFTEPRLLLAGLPFSFTLIAILLAHELGHYFACRYYSISASYPYFIPAPTLIGTLGAFIRIRSPIVNRKALFDVGIAGPVIGFFFAVPALAIAIAHSKVVPLAQANAAVVFGDPLLSKLLVAWLRPGISPSDLLLHPVGRAAWVGLFATALNLLPAGQLDGGHILYSLASDKHRRLSLAVALLLVPLGLRFWAGWLFWATLLLLIGFRHPPLLNRWEPLGRKRQLWAAAALLIFFLCFMPSPFTFHN